MKGEYKIIRIIGNISFAYTLVSLGVILLGYDFELINAITCLIGATIGSFIGSFIERVTNNRHK